MSVTVELLAAGQDRLVVFVLALARVSGLFLMAPVLASRAIPVRVRAALAVFMTVAMLPLLGHATPGPSLTALALVGTIALELGVGFLIGAVAQLVFGGVQMAGQLAGIQMGIGLANLIDPQTQEHITAFAQWQNLMALLAFLAVDGHHMLIRAVAQSFALVPLAGGLPQPQGVVMAVALASGLFVVALKIAAPVMVMLLLVNGAMAVLSKLIPQLNVFIVGFPLNVAAGLFMLGAAQPATVRFLITAFGDSATSLAAVLSALH